MNNTDTNQKLQYPAGIKWTKQRKCVYQVLANAAEPLSARQIYMLVEEMAGNETYALSTIYRILTVFEENGLVSGTTWLGDDTVVYELDRGTHTHYAVCLDCHKRIPLSGCPFTIGHFGHHRSEERREELTDFTVIGHKVELYGYCHTCGENHHNFH